MNCLDKLGELKQIEVFEGIDSPILVYKIE